MPSLVSLSDLKTLLRIAENDTSEDNVLNACLDAAEEYVLSVTKYSTTAETGRVDLFFGVPVGRRARLWLTLRPVSSVTSVEVRPEGGEWSSVSGYEVQGDSVVLYGGWETPPVFESIAPVRIYDVRVTYDVSPMTTPPARLKQAALRLASYLYDIAKSGASVSTAAADIRTELSKAAVPDDVVEMLSSYAGRWSASWV